MKYFKSLYFIVAQTLVLIDFIWSKAICIGEFIRRVSLTGRMNSPIQNSNHLNSWSALIFLSDKKIISNLLKTQTGMSKLRTNTIFLLTLSFLLSTNLSAQEQRFKAGLNMGITAAQINGDASADFNKLGLSAGLRVYTILTPKSDLIIEILYSQRGSRTELISSSNLPQQIIRLNYIEVPVIYTFKDWYQDDDDYHKMHFQGGLSYGRLFSTSFLDSPLEEVAPFFRENDFSWLLGITFHTSAHVGFYARYSRSINLLFKNTNSNPNANSLLSFFLTFGGTYVF